MFSTHVDFLFFFKCYADHRDLHSFPTRRSSDLNGSPPRCRRHFGRERRPTRQRLPRRHHSRSEEHTSELQSRFDLVCRLLIEKKKHWMAQSPSGDTKEPKQRNNRKSD